MAPEGGQRWQDSGTTTTPQLKPCRRGAPWWQGPHSTPPPRDAPTSQFPHAALPPPPPAPLRQAPKLKTVWLEGNPLGVEAVATLLAALPASGVSALGLDEAQLAQLPLATRDPLVAAAGPKLRVAAVAPGGPGEGYFKLERAQRASAHGASSSNGSGAGASGSSSLSSIGGNGSSRPSAHVLVVSFGSAPGTPNWGGLLKKVRAAAAAAGAARWCCCCCRCCRWPRVAPSGRHVRGESHAGQGRRRAGEQTTDASPASAHARWAHPPAYAASSPCCAAGAHGGSRPGRGRL